jgi:hypothetical protein
MSINILQTNKFSVENNSFKICVTCTYIHLNPYATFFCSPYRGQLGDGLSGFLSRHG